MYHIHCVCLLLLATLFCMSLANSKDQSMFEDNPKTFSARDDAVNTGQIYCYCSPTNRGYSIEAKTFITKSIEQGDKMVREWWDKYGGPYDASTTSTLLKEFMVQQILKCRDNYTTEDCYNADASLRETSNILFCKYDKGSGKNVYPTDNTQKTVATTKPCSSTRASSKTGTKGKGPGEGCVAIEHLQGHVLQHKRHLMRPVLCHNGFCATPNHAIIVHGKMASMRQLCGSGQWACTWDTKLVNNLKISANRRAFVGDIIITPYDIRFPTWSIWLIQMLEDAAALLMFSVSCGIIVYSGILIAVLSLDGTSPKSMPDRGQKLAFSRPGNTQCQPRRVSRRIDAAQFNQQSQKTMVY